MFARMRFLPLVPLVVALVALAGYAEDDDPTGPGNNTRTFIVTIENMVAAFDSLGCCSEVNCLISG